MEVILGPGLEKWMESGEIQTGEVVAEASMTKVHIAGERQWQVKDWFQNEKMLKLR